MGIPIWYLPNEDTVWVHTHTHGRCSFSQNKGMYFYVGRQVWRLGAPNHEFIWRYLAIMGSYDETSAPENLIRCAALFPSVRARCICTGLGSTVRILKGAMHQQSEVVSILYGVLMYRMYNFLYVRMLDNGRASRYVLLWSCNIPV